MSRSETLKLVETYLSRARDMVQRSDDDVLCYLIDVAISETQGLMDSGNSEASMEQHQADKHDDRKSRSSSVLHLLAGDKVN